MDEDEDMLQAMMQDKHNALMEDLVLSIKKILPALQKGDDKPLMDLIKKNSEALDQFLVKIREVSKPVYLNQDSVIEEIKTMAVGMVAGLKELLEASKRPTEWKFTVSRDFSGRIDVVTAKAKAYER